MSGPPDQPTKPSTPYGIALRGEMLADIEAQFNDIFARYQATPIERYWILGVMRHAVLHHVANLEAVARAHGLTPKDMMYEASKQKDSGPTGR